ncbi:MAG TPA: HEAT repeat domain-containing protein [Acidimicrobiales bacterium]
MADDLIPRADALGKRVSGHPEHQREVVPALIAMLWQAAGPDELVAVVEALGKAWSDAATLALLSLADHSDADVRFAVACALPCGVEHDEAAALVAGALCLLARDGSPDVRDWAVFGLGTQLDVDTAEVREVLRERLWDPDLDVRMEALRGLAARRDPGVLELIRDQLAAEEVEWLAVDAARAFADRSLVAALRELERAGWDEDPDLLAEALRACASGRQEDC